MADVYPIDATGKMLTCRASEFVRGDASRFCIRPAGHEGPHAWPQDPLHAECQRELARVRAALAAADEKRHAAEVARQEADAYAERLRSVLTDAVALLQVLAAYTNEDNRAGILRLVEDARRAIAGEVRR